MHLKNLFDHESLAAQAHRQRKYAWDLEKDFAWESGIDLKKALLPLDEACIAFPGASPEQRLALSQYLGIIVNATIAELEEVIHRFKYTAWTQVLRNYPVGPEMEELGHLFFEEELKHSEAFYRFIDIFCAQTGVNRHDLNRLLPKSYGSLLVKGISWNARHQGHAFWWVVAAAEEISIEIYHQMHPFRASLDPLYLQVHQKHMEEESRHHNYAFLILDLISRTPKGLRGKWHEKTDLLLAQTLTTGWVLSELSKLFEVKHLKDKHPFFATLHSCLPLLKSVPLRDTLRKLFQSAPYLSLILNPKNHEWTQSMAKKLGTFSMPGPTPKLHSLMAP